MLREDSWGQCSAFTVFWLSLLRCLGFDASVVLFLIHIRVGSLATPTPYSSYNTQALHAKQGTCPKSFGAGGGGALSASPALNQDPCHGLFFQECRTLSQIQKKGP